MLGCACVQYHTWIPLPPPWIYLFILFFGRWGGGSNWYNWASKSAPPTYLSVTLTHKVNLPTGHYSIHPFSIPILIPILSPYCSPSILSIDPHHCVTIIPQHNRQPPPRLVKMSLYCVTSVSSFFFSLFSSLYQLYCVQFSLLFGFFSQNMHIQVIIIIIILVHMNINTNA